MILDLPQPVLSALESALKPFDLGALQRASGALTQAYRSDQNSNTLFDDPVVRAAYLAVRLPATYGCLRAVFSTLDLSEDYTSLLDLGAGPATAYGALWDRGLSFDPEKAFFYEQSGPLFHQGAALWEAVTGAPQPGVLHAAPLSSTTCLPEADLVVMSFFLGEIEDPLATQLLQKAWAACQKTLVIVEPGTPARFERLRQWRQDLIRWGGRIQAPCPHDQACPMAGTDWCHFSVKIYRSSAHRLIKGVDHPYELEKYAYLVVSKTKALTPGKARIFRTPLKKTGHIIRDLCTPQGLIRDVVSKKEKGRYALAKKESWGDTTENP